MHKVNSEMLSVAVYYHGFYLMISEKLMDCDERVERKECPPESMQTSQIPILMLDILSLSGHSDIPHL